MDRRKTLITTIVALAGSLAIIPSPQAEQLDRNNRAARLYARGQSAHQLPGREVTPEKSTSFRSYAEGEFRVCESDGTACIDYGMSFEAIAKTGPTSRRLAMRRCERALNRIVFRLQTENSLYTDPTVEITQRCMIVRMIGTLGTR